MKHTSVAYVDVQPPAKVQFRFETTGAVEVAEIIHRCPMKGQHVTPCCDRSPLELPPTDRLTLDRELVTCSSSGEPVLLPLRAEL